MVLMEKNKKNLKNKVKQFIQLCYVKYFKKTQKMKMPIFLWKRKRLDNIFFV